MHVDKLKKKANVRRRKFYTFKRRRKEEGYNIQIKWKEFSRWYRQQKRCVLCGEFLASREKYVAIILKSVYLDKTVTINNIGAAHLRCAEGRPKGPIKQRLCYKCGAVIKTPYKRTCEQCRAPKLTTQICQICQICGEQFSYGLKGRRRKICFNPDCKCEYSRLQQAKQRAKPGYKIKCRHRSRKYRHSPKGRALKKLRLIKKRCEDINWHNYYRYGGRGIKCLLEPDVFSVWHIQQTHCSCCGEKFNNSLQMCKHLHRINMNAHYTIGNLMAVCPPCHSKIHARIRKLLKELDFSLFVY